MTPDEQYSSHHNKLPTLYAWGIGHKGRRRKKISSRASHNCDVNRSIPRARLYWRTVQHQRPRVRLFYLLERLTSSENPDTQAPCLLLIMPQAVIPSTLSTLTKYSVFFKATLEDATEHYTLTGTTTQREQHALSQPPYTVRPTDAGGWTIQLSSLLLNPTHNRQLTLTPQTPIPPLSLNTSFSLTCYGWLYGCRLAMPGHTTRNLTDR